jgi:CubicO group peptidase (beta-lactamase class C family)
VQHPIDGHCDERFAAVRRAFERNLCERGEVGAAVTIYIDAEPVVDLWGGFADAGRERPWLRDTIAHVASTTKGMTSICMHRLVEEGRLDLDAPVARYWPEFAQAGKGDLPVHLLLSHRAGLPAIRRDLPEGSLYDWTLMTETLAAESPWWEPGTQHGYHAISFGYLAGELLRRIDGRTLGRFFRDEIAAPLALDFHIGLDARHDGRCAEMIPMPRSGVRNPIYDTTRKRDSTARRAPWHGPTPHSHAAGRSTACTCSAPRPSRARPASRPSDPTRCCWACRCATGWAFSSASARSPSDPVPAPSDTRAWADRSHSPIPTPESASATW